MKLSSVQKAIQELFASGFYRVPRFQRPYSWTRTELEEFWEDAFVDGDDGYFMGSIVVYRESNTQLGIVDGQQRLTTITLLLCALRQSLREVGAETRARGVHGYIEREDVDGIKRYVIKGDPNSTYLPEHLLKWDAAEVQKQSGKLVRSLEEASKFFVERIAELVSAVPGSPGKARDKKVLRALEACRDRALGLTVILVELGGEDDAYLVFETLNARGKDLRVSDLVRNHLTKMLPSKNKDIDAASTRWTDLSQRLDSPRSSPECCVAAA